MAETTATSDEQYSEKIAEVLDKISEFTLMELSELVSAFETRFGIEAAAGVPMALAAAAAPAAEEEAEEPTAFNVVLTGFGDKKIQVIKAVRAVTTLALKEAKAVVEGVPSNIKEGVSKEEAEKCADALKEAGGEVEIKPE